MDTSLPPSAVPASTGWYGCVGALLAFGIIVALRLPAGLALLMLVGITGTVLFWVEWRRLGRHYVRGPAIRPGLRKRGAMVVAILYMLATLTHLTLGGGKTASVHEVLVPFFGLGAVALVAVCWLGRSRQDGLYDLGEAVTDVFNRLRRRDSMVTTIGGWLIKAFFLPLMLAWSYTWLAKIEQALPSLDNPYSLFVVLMAAFYAVDTAFGVIGYLTSSSAIGAQIRSVDRTWLGCLSALVCYPPMNVVLAAGVLNYHDGVQWKDWLSGHAYLSLIWGLAILLLTFVYMWATIAFGPRFSNLTHRGIITVGPYRWSKHPAYICKNLSWWLISMPFLSHVGVGAAVSCSLALLGVNGIYWLRAVTEERHLRHDPVYCQYAAWIERHGLLARMRFWRQAI